MTSKSFTEKSFGTGCEDLSHLAEGSLTGGGTDQSAGNTVSTPTNGIGSHDVGTPSLQTSVNAVGGDLAASDVSDPEKDGHKFTPSNRVETHNDGDVFGLDS